MSRRYTDRNLTELDTDAELAWEFFESGGIPWWFATRMPEPWDDFLWHQWQNAWADYTMQVAENAWRNTGGRIYAVHRDAMLRDDLKSWLLVKAVEAGAYFTPKPEHPAPERNYAAWLYGRLKVVARDHFTEAVGTSETRAGRDARVAYRSQGPSLERQAEMEAETGYTFAHHALWTRALESDDPANVLIRLEDLAERVEEVEREDLRYDRYDRYDNPPPETCLALHCDRPSKARGFCHTHYYGQRRTAGDAFDAYYTYREACSVEGCEREHFGLGLCKRHYEEQRKANAPLCSEEGCDRPVQAKGLCGAHYQEQRTATLGTCTAEGCTTQATHKATDERGPVCGRHARGTCTQEGCHAPARARGLCSAHGATPCKVPGCTSAARARGLCKRHKDEVVP